MEINSGVRQGLGISRHPSVKIIGVNMSLTITSFSFICFLTLTALVYYVVPRNRWIVLLVASWFYYGYMTKGYMGAMAVSTLSFWIGSLIVTHNNLIIKESGKTNEHVRIKYKRVNKAVMATVIGMNVGLLLFHKFYPGAGLPLAISFYTLSGISYLVDVSKGDNVEKNICKFSLILCYFPLVTQGPIVRHKTVKDTLYGDNKLNLDNILQGVTLILWGGVKKLVIADRLYHFVDVVFNEYNHYTGAIIPLAVIGYMIQLYCDFSGGIEIILGCGRLFGVELPANFRQPYFSASVSEFWRRWHISLGNWFKDYVYMPLAMSKVNNKAYSILKKKYGNRIAKLVTTSTITFIVWLLNGVWHGAGWKYVVFGAYMGVLIAFENDTKNKTRKEEGKCSAAQLLCTLRTLLLVAFGWMLIRVNTLADFPQMILATFKGNSENLVATLHTFLNDMDWAALLYGILLVFTVEFLQQRKEMKERMDQVHPILKIMAGVILIFTWLILSYDTGNEVRGFIYAKF